MLAGNYFENSLERTIGTDSNQPQMWSSNKIPTNPLRVKSTRKLGAVWIKLYISHYTTHMRFSGETGHDVTGFLLCGVSCNFFYYKNPAEFYRRITVNYASKRFADYHLQYQHKHIYFYKLECKDHARPITHTHTHTHTHTVPRSVCLVLWPS